MYNLLKKKPSNNNNTDLVRPFRQTPDIMEEKMHQQLAIGLELDVAHSTPTSKLALGS